MHQERFPLILGPNPREARRSRCVGPHASYAKYSLREELPRTLVESQIVIERFLRKKIK